MTKGRVLVIAGSDSSGGAGLEADQKVIAAHLCYAMTATTALTAQNTQGVHDVHHTPPAFVAKQIDACIEDIGVDAVKIGMLASSETIKVIAAALKRHKVAAIVLDPVMVATSGGQLLAPDAVRELREDLLPMATVVTPNVPEAKLLLLNAGQSPPDISCVEDLVFMAKSIQALGPKYVLVKGGHSPFKRDGHIACTESEKEMMVDVLYGEGRVTRIVTVYQASRNTHGTGCSLASAIASNLARGINVQQSVSAACKYIEAGIRSAPDFGLGNGPINHFHSLQKLPFPPNGFIQWLLERTDVARVWKEHTHHSFVAGLANGTLPVDRFKYYLIQDYLYLVQFARATALAAYKAKSIDDIAASARTIVHIQTEMALHLDYCKDFGVSKKEIEATQESQACTAYTRYVLDVGQSEDWLALQISMAPCLIGYGTIAHRLYNDPGTKREGNIYWKWIENYVADDYSDAVKVGSDLLEKHATQQSPSRIEELVKIFIHATNMEIGFWNMGTGLDLNGP